MNLPCICIFLCLPVHPLSTYIHLPVPSCVSVIHIYASSCVFLCVHHPYICIFLCLPMCISSKYMHLSVSSCAPVLLVGINNDLEDLRIAYSTEKENLFCILTLWSCHYFHSACPIILNKALFWNLQYIGEETVQNILLIHSFIHSGTYKTISTVFYETYIVLPT